MAENHFIFFCPFWSSVCCYRVDESSVNILQNFLFCVPWKKAICVCLKQYEGD